MAGQQLAPHPAGGTGLVPQCFYQHDLQQAVEDQRAARTAVGRLVADHGEQAADAGRGDLRRPDVDDGRQEALEEIGVGRAEFEVPGDEPRHRPVVGATDRGHGRG